MGSRQACRIPAELRGLGLGGRSATPPAATGRRGEWQGARIRPQHLQEARGPMGSAQGGRHRFFGSAAVDIEIEEVFPRWIAAWPRLQLAEIDAELVEAGQQAIQGAGLVRHGADERGLLAVARSLDPGRAWSFRTPAADQEKAGDVFLDRLDPFRRNRQLVEFGGAPAGNGGLIWPPFPLHLAGGSSGVVDGNRLEPLPHDEGLALSQRLRMRENALYLTAIRPRQDQQTVINLKRHLGDHQRS